MSFNNEVGRNLLKIQYERQVWWRLRFDYFSVVVFAGSAA